MLTKVQLPTKVNKHDIKLKIRMPRNLKTKEVLTIRKLLIKITRPLNNSIFRSPKANMNYWAISVNLEIIAIKITKIKQIIIITKTI